MLELKPEKRKKQKMSNIRVIAISFLAVILTGTLLLCLPFSSASGTWSNPIDCLFTATTATCVTGLVVYDTPVYWSTFGQVVLLLLIQVGGIGFMTLITAVSFFVTRQINLHERRMIQESSGSLHLGGATGTFAQILIGTFVIEAIGAGLLSIRFYPMYGGKGIWYAVFHSVSAFCNAGVDIIGLDAAGVGNSLVNFRDDPLINFTVMFLIIMGGLGFLVWNDLLNSGFRWKKMKLHTKMVLAITGSLILIGAIFYFISEYNAAFAGLPFGSRVMASFFQSVTTRTAGFFTVPQSSLSDAGILMALVLMLIGGSPGSTAGGVKTTTFAVLFLSIVRLSKNREDVVVFKRRIHDRMVRQAGAVIAVYVGLTLAASMLICMLEVGNPAVGMRDVLFETVSAVATVGLSTGITPTLTYASKLILILLMYTGRLGGMSLFLALADARETSLLERPTEKILIG